MGENWQIFHTVHCGSRFAVIFHITLCVCKWLKCFDGKLELPIGTSDMAVKELDCVGPDPFVVCCGVPISISSRFLDGW